MGNVKFRVADASVLRFYPFVEIKTEAGDQLNIEMPDVLIAGRKAEVLVMARNVSVGGVEVFVGTTSVGTTGDDGNLTFTPSREGSFTVTANRAGYVSGSKDIDVVAEGVLKLMLSVTPTTVREGDQINIKVIDSVGKQPIAGADVFFGGKKIDKQTDAKGTISHWVTAPGTYTINATKSGYEEGENVIEVIESAAQFTFSDLTVKPASVEAGTPVKIRVNAVNNGTVAGESKVELLVNNKSVDSKNVTLSSGESTEVEFSHTEDKPGTYTVQVGGLSKSYEVIKKAPFFSGIATLGILATAFVVLRRRRN